MKNLNFWEAVSSIVGTIIGAGILGIPYVVAQAGFFNGLLMIFLLGVAIMFVNLFLGEVVLRTKGKFQLTGYAEKYIGPWGKWFMTVSMAAGIYGALIAYTIGQGEVLQALFGGDKFTYSLIFFAIFSLFLFIGIQLIKILELGMTVILFLVVILIALLSAPAVEFSNLIYIDIAKILFPYGVVLFAFLGVTAIYQAREILGRRPKQLKKAIIFASFIPVILYVIFALVVVGVTGLNTTEIATIGLGEVLGSKMHLFGNVFSFFAMGTSFLALGLALVQMYNYDYKLNKGLSWFLTIVFPLSIFLIGARGFIQTLGIVGAIVGGIEGILLVFIYWKAKKKGNRKPEYSFPKSFGKIIGYILILIYIGGLIYTISELF